MHSDVIVDVPKEGEAKKKKTKVKKKTRRRKRRRRRRRRRRSCHPSTFAFAPSFACHSTLASNFLHAIVRYWNCLVGDLSPSAIYFLNRSCLACLACLASPTLLVCTRVRAHAVLRHVKFLKRRFTIGILPLLFFTAFSSPLSLSLSSLSSLPLSIF